MTANIGIGDEAITTSFAFIATEEAIALLDAKFVFVDIDLCTYNIDPPKIAVAITLKTKAIIQVSWYGQCADFDTINSIYTTQADNRDAMQEKLRKPAC